MQVLQVIRNTQNKYNKEIDTELICRKVKQKEPYNRLWIKKVNLLRVSEIKDVLAEGKYGEQQGKGVGGSKDV